MSIDKKSTKNETFYFDTLGKVSPIDLVTALARELSCDFVAQTNICSELSTKHPEVHNMDSAQEAFVAQLFEILTERIMLEIVAVPIDKENYSVTMYMFGRDKPTFAFSIECLKKNPTISKCLCRMMSSGHEIEGETFFKRYTPPDRSRIEYTDFKFNELFSRHFLRSGYFVHFVMVCIAGIDIFLGDRYPETTIANMATVLLNRVVFDVDSKLTQFVMTNGNSAPWVTKEVRDIVNKMVNEKKTAADVKKLFSEATAEHVKSYPLIKHSQ